MKVTLEMVIEALNQLGGEAQSVEIKNRLLENLGGVPENYKDKTSFYETIQVIIQTHCPVEKKYKYFRNVFTKVGRGRFILS